MKMLQGHLELGRCEHSKVNKPAPKKQEQECQEGDFWSTDEASPYGQHWCGHQDVAGPGHLRTVHQFNTSWAYWCCCSRAVVVSMICWKHYMEKTEELEAADEPDPQQK